MSKTKNDDELFCLTPWGCLYSVLKDYNVDASHVTGRMGEMIVNDFMDAMEKAGYVRRNEDVTDG